MKLRVTIDQQTYEVEVGDIHVLPVIAIVDGETFEVWPEMSETSAAAKQSSTVPAIVPGAKPPQHPPSGIVVSQVKAITAPIPGVILSVMVKPGDTVKFGQELCVLEAMKMKNLIRANRAGTIESVQVSPGDQVRHSQVLFEFTE